MQKETDIQKSILDYLSYKENAFKCYCFRAQAGAIRTEGGGYMRFGKAGVPDIVCCVKGKFIGLEVKNEKGKQSLNQQVAEGKIKHTGGKYYIVRSIDDVEKIIK